MPVGRIFASREAAAGCRRQQKGGIAAGKMPRSGRIVAQQQEKCAKGGERSTRSVPSRQGHCHKAAKGFKFVCAQLLFLCAASRFAKPRSSLKKVLIFSVRSCGCGVLVRGLQNLETSLKGFNCCSAKLPLRSAESRLAKPRYSLQRERIVTFCIVQKVTKKHAGRSPATHDSNRRSIRCFCESDRRSSGNRLC